MQSQLIYVCFSGASDCAVCVGVSLEIARSLIESKKTLETPILFLFNGGEETILQVGGVRSAKRWNEYFEISVGTYPEYMLLCRWYASQKIHLDTSGSGKVLQSHIVLGCSMYYEKHC